MAKKALIAKQQRKPKYKVRAYNRCKICGRPRAYMPNLDCVASVSANSHTKVNCQGLLRRAGKL